ncbi:methionine ABC transporter permease [Zhihengliuella halotolerans]|uniref:D-methionine transport system permease protein n=1 Tax=Zhihengliuella halotolerans TaxID=370736 RepID=A0A4Q8AAA2_9MICC|nr:methionine ABC transporter permease [Zhihengliuella halotolerans]RZU61040.1 D-methionine transport system permease protein [Zhihengliuella halotolerans]
MDWLTSLLENPGITDAMPTAIAETLIMMVLASVATIIIGIPLGVVLFVTARGGLAPVRWVNVVLSAIIVNITRSIPYAILMLTLIPFTKWIVGTGIGPYAACVSLTIGTVPFFARLVETALRDIHSGKIDAALVMGSTRFQVVRKIMLPEALPGIMAGITTMVVIVIGYSAMAGIIGGGGLGRLAYNYGFQRFDSQVMVATLVVIVIIVQLVQATGDWLTRKVDHR